MNKVFALLIFFFMAIVHAVNEVGCDKRRERRSACQLPSVTIDMVTWMLIRVTQLDAHVMDGRPVKEEVIDLFRYRNTYTVGRSVTCNLRMLSSLVSRMHGELRLINNTVFVKDLKSSNGTYVNKHRILPDRELSLHEGDQIGFGANAIMGPESFVFTLAKSDSFQRPVECIELSSDDERSQMPDSSQPSPQAVLFAPLKDCSHPRLQVDNSTDVQAFRKRHLLDDCHIPCKMQLDSECTHGLVSSTSCSHSGIEPSAVSLAQMSGEECLGTFSRSDTPLASLVPAEMFGSYQPLSSCIGSPSPRVQVATVPSPSPLAECPRPAALTCCPHTEKHSKSACVVEHSLPAVTMCHSQCTPVCQPVNVVENSHPPVIESPTHSATNPRATGRRESFQSLVPSSAVMECPKSLVDRHAPHYVMDPGPANVTECSQPLMGTSVSAPVPYQKHAQVMERSHTMMNLNCSHSVTDAKQADVTECSRLITNPCCSHSVTKCSPLVIDPCSPHSVTGPQTSSVTECSPLVLDPCSPHSVTVPKASSVTECSPLVIDPCSSHSVTGPQISSVTECSRLIIDPSIFNSVIEPKPAAVLEFPRPLIDTGFSDSKSEPKLMGMIERSHVVMDPCSLNSLAVPKPSQTSESSQLVIDTGSSDSETDEMECSRLVMDPSSSNSVIAPKPADVTRLMIDKGSSDSATEPKLTDVMEHSRIVKDPCSSNSVIYPKPSDLPESLQLVIHTNSLDSDSESEQADGVGTVEPVVASLSTTTASPPPSVNTPVCPPCVVVLTKSSVVNRRTSPGIVGAERNSCSPAPVVPSRVAAASSPSRTSSLIVEDSGPAETIVSSPASTVPTASSYLSTSPNAYPTDDDDMMEEQPVVVKLEFPKNVFAEDEIITISDDEAYPSSQLFEETEANGAEGANRTVLEDESDSFDHFLFMDLHADGSDLHPGTTDDADQNIESARAEAEVTRTEEVGDYEVSRDQPSTSGIVVNKASSEDTLKERTHKRKQLKTSKRGSAVETAVNSKNRKERQEKLKSLCKKVKEAHREETKEILLSKSEDEVEKCKKSPTKVLPMNIKVTDKNRSAMLTEAILAPVDRPRGRLRTSTASKVKNVKQDVKKIIESKNKLHCPTPVESRPPLKRLQKQENVGQQIRRIPKLSFKDLARPSTSTASSATSMQSPLSSQVLGISSTLTSHPLAAARLPDPAPQENIRKKSVRFREGSQLEQVRSIPALQRDERAVAAPQGITFRRGSAANMSDIIQEICSWKISWFWLQDQGMVIPPTVDPKSVLPMLDFFISHDDYRNIVERLMFCELWEIVCDESKEKQSFCFIAVNNYKNAGVPDFQLMDIYCYIKTMPNADQMLKLVVRIGYRDFRLRVRDAMRLRPLSYIRPTLRAFRAVRELHNSPLCSLILNPKREHFRYPPITEELFLQDSLNFCQENAVLEIAQVCRSSGQNVCLIQGPPGTGKSHVIVSLVVQLLYGSARRLEHKTRILLCGQSNAVVDELVRRLLTMRSRLNTPNRMKLVRYGQEETMHPEVQVCSVQSIARRNLQNTMRQNGSNIAQRSVHDNIRTLSHDLSLLQSQSNPSPEDEHRKAYLISRINTLKSTLKDSTFQREMCQAERAERLRVVAGAEVVCTTIGSCCSPEMEDYFRRDQSTMRYSCCIIDEATKCWEPEALIPLLLRVSKLVLVGDPAQLQGIVRSSLAKKLGFEKSLFGRISSCISILRPNPVKFLSEQYRMHPAISYWPNKYFYRGRLKDAVGHQSPCPLKPYVVLALGYVQGVVRENTEEAEFVVQLAMAAREEVDASFSVGIITPYNLQKQAILRLLHAHGRHRYRDLSVDVIDSVQGQERDVVLVSMVRTDGVGFLSNESRLNVALTRARHSLILCGNFTSLKGVRAWDDLLRDAQERHLFMKVSEKHANNRIYLRSLIMNQ